MFARRRLRGMNPNRGPALNPRKTLLLIALLIALAAFFMFDLGRFFLSLIHI